jgi:hypothetical protein
LNEKGCGKNETSRLREPSYLATSAEPRKPTANGGVSKEAAAGEGNRYREEQAAGRAGIAKQQEAECIGSESHSGRDNYFAGSADNVHIPSKASSTSTMVRRMCKGMKKYTLPLGELSLTETFVRASATNAALFEVNQSQVFLVTVGIEREKVDVNLNPPGHVGRSTKHPKFGTNSVDADARRSIVISEKGRAEVPAAVKKGSLGRELFDLLQTSINPNHQ